MAGVKSSLFVIFCGLRFGYFLLYSNGQIFVFDDVLSMQRNALYRRRAAILQVILHKSEVFDDWLR